MRSLLWPDSAGDHGPETAALLGARPDDVIVLVAERPTGGLAAFLEARKRAYAEGCVSSPVGYIEGWWVDADVRREGLGTELAAEAEAWARAQGLTQMASDAELDNRSSHAVHQSLGYSEVGRVVCFRKQL